MKRTRLLFLTVFFLISASIGVLAADGMKKVEAYLRGDFQVFLDGEKVDVGTVLVYKDKSYLPISEMGKLVGSEVKWNAKNKGIYINQRFPGQPTQPAADNLTYDEMNLYQPSVYKVSYLGGEHTVLSNTDYQYKMYYREKDLNRMGIDTHGLRKARNPFTEQLYISEDEVKNAWKEKPVFTYSYEFTIIGDKDEDRTKSVTNFIEGIPAMEAVLRGEDPTYYYNPPTVYAVDALPDNEYNILTGENGKFSWYWLKLKQNRLDQWYQSDHTKKTQELILNW